MPVPTAVGHGWGGEVRDPGRRRRGGSAERETMMQTKEELCPREPPV